MSHPTTFFPRGCTAKPQNGQVVVERLQPKHVKGAVELQRACFPEPFPAEALWSDRHLMEHLRKFPEGQFVVVDSGRVVATASNLVITEDNWQRHSPWVETTGDFDFHHHDASGSTLFGADISVHPDYRGRGIARALYSARYKLVGSLGLRRYGTACRIPGWLAWAKSHGGGQLEYCHAVIQSDVVDRTLTPLLRMGLVFVAVTMNHMDDPESGDAAAVLEWVP